MSVYRYMKEKRIREIGDIITHLIYPSSVIYYSYPDSKKYWDMLKKLLMEEKLALNEGKKYPEFKINSPLNIKIKNFFNIRKARIATIERELKKNKPFRK